MAANPPETPEVGSSHFHVGVLHNLDWLKETVRRFEDSVRGPQGEPGPAGPAGPVGAAGAAGAFAVSWQGAWDPAGTYSVGAIVGHQDVVSDAVWVAVEEPVAGVAPAEPVWSVVLRAPHAAVS
ncbi:hypothetical protein [Saccharothrix sp. ST-888]|uniref:hypothetical protein n=1 Tax=Saccharothrix sp. ST-888 TaxID=1427391 RepID=UPI0005EC4703|nr:hypothetical protein [Saccharothrix sp. ST-888]KJK55358.1 hypothetical protein UK12_29240 [Saccharothrix sp. ST-888]